jgi:hypothetical protein
MLSLAANRFTLSILAARAAIVFGRKSKMSHKLVCKLMRARAGMRGLMRARAGARGLVRARAGGLLRCRAAR